MNIFAKYTIKHLEIKLRIKKSSITLKTNLNFDIRIYIINVRK